MKSWYWSYRQRSSLLLSLHHYYQRYSTSHEVPSLILFKQEQLDESEEVTKHEWNMKGTETSDSPSTQWGIAQPRNILFAGPCLCYSFSILQTLPGGPSSSDVSVYPPLFATFPLWREKEERETIFGVERRRRNYTLFCRLLCLWWLRMRHGISNAGLAQFRISWICKWFHFWKGWSFMWGTQVLFSFAWLTHTKMNWVSSLIPDAEMTVLLSLFCEWQRRHFNEFVAVASV